MPRCFKKGTKTFKTFSVSIIIAKTHVNVFIHLKLCVDYIHAIQLHTLHFMTEQLLPAFLSCFKDDHISIRIEATTIAGELKLTHPHVLQALYKLLQDPCWKVKAHALRAFADIGVSSEDLVTKLLWAVRFEKLPAIQAEACHTIAKLGLNEEKVIHTLRELLMVEDEELVLRCVHVCTCMLTYMYTCVCMILLHVYTTVCI